MLTKQEVTAHVERVLESKEAVASVVNDIMYSGVPEVIVADDKLIKKLGEKFSKKAELRSKQVQADNATLCPICKCPLKPVLLADNKKAVYCSKHFVVFPVKENS